MLFNLITIFLTIGYVNAIVPGPGPLPSGTRSNSLPTQTGGINLPTLSNPRPGTSRSSSSKSATRSPPITPTGSSRSQPPAPLSSIRPLPSNLNDFVNSASRTASSKTLFPSVLPTNVANNLKGDGPQFLTEITQKLNNASRPNTAGSGLKLLKSFETGSISDSLRNATDNARNLVNALSALSQKINSRDADLVVGDFANFLNVSARIPLVNRSAQQEAMARRLDDGTTKLATQVLSGQPMHRDGCSLIKSDNLIRGNCGSKTNSSASTFRFGLSNSPFPSVRSNWTRNNLDGPLDVFSYRIAIRRIAEVNGTITIANSTNVLRFGASSAGNWTSLKNGHIVNGVGSAKYHTFSTSFAPGGSWGNLLMTVTFYVSAGGFAVNEDGAVLDPNGVKYTLTLQHWPYQFKNGRIAVETYLQTAFQDFSSSISDYSDGISFGANSATMDWDSFAIVDNAVQSLTHSKRIYHIYFYLADPVLVNDADEELDPLANALEAKFAIYHHFPVRADFIQWDPQVKTDESAVTDLVTSFNNYQVEVLINQNQDPEYSDPSSSISDPSPSSTSDSLSEPSSTTQPSVPTNASESKTAVSSATLAGSILGGLFAIILVALGIKIFRSRRNLRKAGSESSNHQNGLMENHRAI